MKVKDWEKKEAIPADFPSNRTQRRAVQNGKITCWKSVWGEVIELRSPKGKVLFTIQGYKFNCSPSAINL